MVIRPPRKTRNRHSRRHVRDVIAAVIVSALIVAFGLRLLMALLGVEPWSVAWEVVILPTDLLVDVLHNVDLLEQPLANRLTPAEVLAFVLVAFAGLTTLASIGLRRE